jgi:molybdenum-dependent DNA-binding transcriptional regulator ModE
MIEFERIERRLKLRDLRVLISVVQTGSMSETARRLGTSQPAVSRSISELEQLVGARLLDRDPHGIEPTSHGRSAPARCVRSRICLKNTSLLVSQNIPTRAFI